MQSKTKIVLAMLTGTLLLAAPLWAAPQKGLPPKKERKKQKEAPTPPPKEEDQAKQGPEPGENRRRAFDLRPYIPLWMQKEPLKDPARFQIHLFYRAAKQLEGAQLGLLANEVVDDMLGLQVSGVLNLVGHDGAGIQYSHGLNLVGGDYVGLQFAGLANRVVGDFVGLQYGLVTNIVKGRVIGGQWSYGLNVAGSCYGICASLVFNSLLDGGLGIAAGIVNYAGGSFTGLHVGGFNFVGEFEEDSYVYHLLDPASERPPSKKSKDIYLTGLQVGLINMGPQIRGAQIGMVSNLAHGLYGFQLSLGYNQVKSDGWGAGVQHAIFGQNRHRGAFSGIQAAFTGNSSGDLKGIQASILLNKAQDAQGLQVSLLVNDAYGMDGFQQAALANVARTLHGVQLALVNVASAEMKGWQVGLVNVGGACTGMEIGVVNICKTIRGVQLGAINIAYRQRVPFMPILLAGNGNPRK